MTNKKSIVLIITIVVCILSIGLGLTTSFASDKDLSYTVSFENDAYVFPIRPEINPKEWAALENHVKRLEALQIPKEVLASISTKGLVITYLSYPFLVDLFCYNDYSLAIESTAEQFNGLSELLSRQDIGDVALDLYKNMDLKELKNKEENSTLKLAALEIILAQKSVLETMSQEARGDLLRECVSKYNQILQDYIDYYDVFEIEWIIASVLYMDNPEFKSMVVDNDAIMRLIETGYPLHGAENFKEFKIVVDKTLDVK